MAQRYRPGKGQIGRPGKPTRNKRSRRRKGKNDDTIEYKNTSGFCNRKWKHPALHQPSEKKKGTRQGLYYQDKRGKKKKEKSKGETKDGNQLKE